MCGIFKTANGGKVMWEFQLYMLVLSLLATRSGEIFKIWNKNHITLFSLYCTSFYMFCTVYFRTLKNDFEYSTHMFLSLEKKFKNDEAQGVSCFKYEKNHITSFSPYCIFHFLYIYYTFHRAFERNNFNISNIVYI